MHSAISAVTAAVIARSRATRAAYLARIQRARQQGRARHQLHCGNIAHGLAACSLADKNALKGETGINIGIVTAYNDMLSAHQPYAGYPDALKQALARAGAVGQVAGGVPAMCDGITQGQDGMELSLFSRDVIALSTAVALSHAMFDGVLLLGVCDKIVPGLLIGALSFGHLPMLFVPAGPMPSGISNKEKQRVRQLYAEGKVGREALLESELASYHSAGTCTFYGTANSNQLLLEMMGVQLPGSSFINPQTPLRDALTEAAAHQIVALVREQASPRPFGEVIDEKAIVNAMVGLLATGGSTNHTIHLVAVARAAGILINWDDFSKLSHATPLLTRLYPNGEADVNHFQQAGGMAVLIKELLAGGYLHEDILTSAHERGLRQYTEAPERREGTLLPTWVPVGPSRDTQVLRGHDAPFAPTGGIEVMSGNLGRGIIKVSAVKPEHRVVEAPALVFDEQQQLLDAFKAGELNQDFVAVLRYQGPRANGMPELHQLTPTLGVLLDRGFKVALVTDGRMSGASGKVAAVLHLCPEASQGGALALVQNGDRIRVDSQAGTLDLLVEPAVLARRIASRTSGTSHAEGCGRELFGNFRALVGTAEEGASSLGLAV